MKYGIDGEDLCIRIPIDALAESAQEAAFGPAAIPDKAAFALAVGRELCDCEDAGGLYYIVHPIHAAISRVIEAADPTIEFRKDDKS